MLAESLVDYRSVVGVMVHLVCRTVAVFLKAVGDFIELSHGEILHLHDFFIKGHAREQVLDAGVDRRLRVFIQRAGSCGHRSHQCGNYNFS